MKKLNKKIFLILGFLLVAAGITALVIYEKQRPKSHSDYVAEDPMVFAFNTLNSLGERARESLIRLMMHHKGDIFMVDFTLPDEAGFGDNPERELFNPLGGGVSIPLANYLEEFSSNPQIIFTIANRIEGLGTEETDLVMVVPDLKEDICDYMRQEADVDPVKKSNTSQAELDLTPFPYIPDRPVTIRLPENKKAGCIQAQNRLYYVYVIFPR